uniref:RING-type domain-containing protein n=1 Tax=Cannabis sativa TaxID=3483 RepID=A0A803QYT0_CANSA
MRMRTLTAYTEDNNNRPIEWHYTVLDDRNFEIRGQAIFFVIIIFSVLLVVTLLVLYARWICRYRHVSFPIDSARGGGPVPSTQGLDAAVIKGMPIILHQAEEEGEAVAHRAECCICLGVFEEGEKVKVLPQCYHCFHPECVDQWLGTHSSCPLCRASLRVETVVPKILVE